LTETPRPLASTTAVVWDPGGGRKTEPARVWPTATSTFSDFSDSFRVDLECRSASNFDLGLEWTPRAGQIGSNELTPKPGLRGWKPMAKHRTHSIEFKRQVAQEFLPARPAWAHQAHDICRNLIRVYSWTDGTMAPKG
jgi:hypothetical protein